jgi:ParB family chromosome partitioning protein
VKGASPRPRGKHPDTVALEQDLTDAVGLTVEIQDKGGVGAVLVRYQSLEQLDDICQRLTGGISYEGE